MNALSLWTLLMTVTEPKGSLLIILYRNEKSTAKIGISIYTVYYLFFNDKMFLLYLKLKPFLVLNFPSQDERGFKVSIFNSGIRVRSSNELSGEKHLISMLYTVLQYLNIAFLLIIICYILLKRKARPILEAIHGSVVGTATPSSTADSTR